MCWTWNVDFDLLRVCRSPDVVFASWSIEGKSLTNLLRLIFNVLVGLPWYSNYTASRAYL